MTKSKRMHIVNQGLSIDARAGIHDPGGTGTNASMNAFSLAHLGAAFGPAATFGG